MNGKERRVLRADIKHSKGRQKEDTFAFRVATADFRKKKHKYFKSFYGIVEKWLSGLRRKRGAEFATIADDLKR